MAILFQMNEKFDQTLKNYFLNFSFGIRITSRWFCEFVDDAATLEMHCVVKNDAISKCDKIINAFDYSLLGEENRAE